MKIDWELFKIQKEYLIAMCDDDDRLTEEIEVIEGVVNLMDAIQDEFKPLDIDECEE